MTQHVTFLPRDMLQALLDKLQANGYRCIGPQVRDGAIVYDDLASVEDLPQGISDAQSPGQYHLQQGDQGRYFAWANGPQALKPLMFSSREPVWECSRDGDGNLQFQIPELHNQAMAIIGARPCDLSALYLQDQHFLQQAYQDDYYLAKRQQLLLIAVNCTHPADTCFCASTGDGPKARFGYDIALTELDDGFVLEVHSDLGKQQIADLGLKQANETQCRQAEQSLHSAAQFQQRSLPSRNLNQALFANLNHPRWEEVTARCLSCGNCTAVCPSCFCNKHTEVPHIKGETSTHYREWDSCFTQGHSYIHGLTIRADTRMRYRQWLTHKLGSWHEQYGRSGCVGCGRCISWCPVGIDLTEEATAICAESMP